jgi:hypothetical protein
MHPSDFGLPVYDSRVLKVANTQESVACIQRALANEDGPVRDVVLLNAGAALYCAGVATSVAEGVRRARDGGGQRRGPGAAEPVRGRHQPLPPGGLSRARIRRGKGMDDILGAHRRRQARGDRRGAAALRRRVDARACRGPRARACHAARVRGGAAPAQVAAAASWSPR